MFNLESPRPATILEQVLWVVVGTAGFVTFALMLEARPFFEYPRVWWLTQALLGFVVVVAGIGLILN